jgi:hypothetical protein
MQPLTRLIRLLAMASALLLTTVATAQQAFLLELSEGKYVGLLITEDGGIVPITSVTILKFTPPVPPPPIVLASKAVILIESEAQTPDQAKLIQVLRNDKAWSKLVDVLDPDLKNEKNQPAPLAVAAKAKAGSNVLPRVLLANDKDEFVGETFAMPATWPDLQKLLTDKGVKP